MVSEVIFPRFWGEVCFEKCFEIVVGSAVSEISRFGPFYVKNTISKFRNHFSIQTTPQNLGKITSETTFSHSKVFFFPCHSTDENDIKNGILLSYYKVKLFRLSVQGSLFVPETSFSIDRVFRHFIF